jgi:hypothetical protein
MTSIVDIFVTLQKNITSEGEPVSCGYGAQRAY